MLGALVSLFFGFAPMILFVYVFYWLDRYEKEPIPLITTVFFWGVIIASGGAFIINTTMGLGIYLITHSDFATDLTTGSLIAPIVEESLKGLAVLIVFFIFHREFDSIVDGIIYAAIAALGFAATENTYYIYTYGYQDGGWSGLFALVFIRVVLVGLQHPFYTAFTGIGLAVARLNRNILIKLIAPLVGFSLAIFTHASHNTLATFLSSLGLVGLGIGTLVDWSGWIFMAAFFAWAIWHEGKYLKTHLAEEVKLGIITPAQYQTAISSLAQTAAKINALFNGKYLATLNFYQSCGELAHKKEQLLTMGNEDGNTLIIQNLRRELARLSADVQV
jgi:protease PrsW